MYEIALPYFTKKKQKLQLEFRHEGALSMTKI